MKQSERKNHHQSCHPVFLKKKKWKAEGKISDLVQGHWVAPKDIYSWAGHKHSKGKPRAEPAHLGLVGKIEKNKNLNHFYNV